MNKILKELRKNPAVTIINININNSGRRLSRTVLSGTSENKRSGANKKIIETNINVNFNHLLFIMPEVLKMFSS